MWRGQGGLASDALIIDQLGGKQTCALKETIKDVEVKVWDFCFRATHLLQEHTM